MRIGEFAKKHGITQDAIRHYLDMGLLVTEKRGGQYKFGESDSNDLSKIMELKQLEFSLNEIQKILTVQRLSGANTSMARNLYLTSLEEKKLEVEEELEKYNKMNSSLDYRIKKIREEESRKAKKLGLPINALSILVCPICESSLDIADGAIEENMIMMANIQCDCGYKGTIEDGIFIDPNAVRTKMLDGKKMPTKEEYLASCSYNYVNFLYKGMTSLIEQLKKYGKEPRYILELDYCVGFFLLQYIRYLPKKTTYILIDYDKNRLIQLKKNLEMYSEHKNFLFLCCDYDRLPIMKLSIDSIVDHGMTKTYFEEAGKLILEIVMPLLKESGLYTAAFQFIASKNKGKFPLETKLEEYLTRDKILNKFKIFHLREIEESDIGQVTVENRYNTNLKSLEFCYGIYSGKKRTIQLIESNDNNIKIVKTLG